MHDKALRCRADVAKGIAGDECKLGPGLDIQNAHLVRLDDLSRVHLVVVGTGVVCNANVHVGADIS